MPALKETVGDKFLEKHFLFIDESGAKGYSASPEKDEGEIGVMAGFLMPEQYLDFFRARFKEATQGFESGGKVHMRELDTEQKNALRNSVFSLFLRGQITWIYEAISTQGFYESEFDLSRGGNQSTQELLHAKLFMGVVNKAFMCMASSASDGVDLTVLTDPLDLGVRKKLENEVKNYLTILKGESIVRVTKKRDPDSGKIHEYVLKSTVESNSDIPKFSAINFSIQCEESEMTIAADVLANSALYYLRRKVAESKGVRLNSKRAIADHPLSSLVRGAYDDSIDVLNFSDIVYRRNDAKKL